MQKFAKTKLNIMSKKKITNKILKTFQNLKNNSQNNSKNEIAR
jgi:hypothetical protein